MDDSQADQLLDWAEEACLPDYLTETLLQHRVRVATLDDLNHDLLNEIGISSVGDRLLILKAIRQSRRKRQSVPSAKYSPSCETSKNCSKIRCSEKAVFDGSLPDEVLGRILFFAMSPEDGHAVLPNKQLPVLARVCRRFARCIWSQDVWQYVKLRELRLQSSLQALVDRRLPLRSLWIEFSRKGIAPFPSSCRPKVPAEVLTLILTFADTLTSVCLQHSQSKVSSSFPCFLPHLTRLKEIKLLQFEHCPVHIKRIALLPRLSVLNLTGTPVDSSAIAAYASSLSRLRELFLTGSLLDGTLRDGRKYVDPTILEGIGRCTTLETLAISAENKRTHVSERDLMPLGRLVQLRSLDITGLVHGFDETQHFAFASTLKKVTTLSFAATVPRLDPQPDALSGLTQLTNLRKLYVQGDDPCLFFQGISSVLRAMVNLEDINIAFDLQPCSDTIASLKQLRRFVGHFNYDGDAPRLERSLECFTHLPRLESLTVWITVPGRLGFPDSIDLAPISVQPFAHLTSLRKLYVHQWGARIREEDPADFFKFNLPRLDGWDCS